MNRAEEWGAAGSAAGPRAASPASPAKGNRGRAGRGPAGGPPALRGRLLLLTFLLACSPPPERPWSILDDTGRVVRLHSQSQRIVSLAPNLTEIIAAAGGQSRLVGTDSFSDFPPAVKALPKVGGVEPSIELITQLRPDLVFAISSSSHPALARALANVNIPLFVVRTDRVADVPRVIERIGEVLDTEPVADASAERLRRALQGSRKTRARRPRVLFAVWLDPLLVAGRNTFIDDLIHLAGGVNAASVNGWPEYSLEAVVADQPDLIVIASRSRTAAQLARFFRETSPWNNLTAIRSGFWYVVDEDRFARLGPRIPEAAAELNRVIDQWEQRH